MLFFETIIRRFFMSLDTVLFNFIGVLYDLLIKISRTSILSQGNIAEFVDRIELLLGIFMLFKISFSLITYIVNPDDFVDKQKGFAKLIQNGIVSLLMLVLVPYVFQLAYTFQSKVLEGNIIARVILGENEEDTGEDFLLSAGDDMAFTVMLPFFKPNTAIRTAGGDLSECINIYEDGKFSEDCKTALKNVGMPTTSLNNYAAGITERSLGLTFREGVAISSASVNGEEVFLIDYMSPISTVVAVVVCLFLVTFCIDIGIRSVKLAFLQLIYPIPVISYMDPKSGKDGMFKKWYQMCFSTYISLFVRLLAVYFGIYIINKVGTFGVYDVVTGAQTTDGWVQIFVIIGVLMFIKQLPKVLENFGIKLDGDGKFTLNPLKKIEEGAVGGKILKKPNEMLGKAAKGIAFAPVHGMSTLGKKTIGGIDAARNGKGFKQGWNRTHGNLYNAYHKKLDEWAPDSAEARKAEREAKENLHQMDVKARRGEEVYKRAKGETKNLNFSAPYRSSYDNVDRAKKEMYQKQAWKTAAIANVEQQLQSGSISEEQAQKMIGSINKDVGNAEKRYDVAKTKHDEMKKLHTKDAAIEEAYDYFDKTATDAQKFFYIENKPKTAKDFVDKYSDPNTFSEIIGRDNKAYSASEQSAIAREYTSMGWKFDSSTNTWSK